jgi:amino acid transporter
MSLPALVGALYFMVSGGPYGLEELARKVGFGGAAAILLAIPFVWSAPTALMVGELAAAVPEEGGYYVWVRRALGPFWGFQEAWLSLAASVFDMAIYPTLFVLYGARLWPPLGAAPVTSGVLMIAACAAANLAGARAVGRGSVALTALLLAPFVVLSVLALQSPAATPHADPAQGRVDIAGAVLIAMWNTMGWDNASTVAGEVVRPQRTYPMAVLIAVGLVALTYVVPLLSMRAAGVSPSDWDTGSWVDAARQLGGPGLAAAVVFGGVVSAFGMFGALLLSYSRLPVALAHDGLMPRAFARRLPRGGAPWLAVIACGGAWTVSLGLSFERLVSLNILLYGTSLVLEFVALAALRVREPDLARPFRVPGGVWGASLLGVAPVLLLGFALVKNAGEQLDGINALGLGLAVVLAGPLVYAATQVGKRRPAPG